MTETLSQSSARARQLPEPKPWHVEGAFSANSVWCVVAADGTVESVHMTLQAARRRCETANLVDCEACPHGRLCRP